MGVNKTDRSWPVLEGGDKINKKNIRRDKCYREMDWRVSMGDWGSKKAL